MPFIFFMLAHIFEITNDIKPNVISTLGLNYTNHITLHYDTPIPVKDGCTIMLIIKILSKGSQYDV